MKQPKSGGCSISCSKNLKTRRQLSRHRSRHPSKPSSRISEQLSNELHRPRCTVVRMSNRETGSKGVRFSELELDSNSLQPLELLAHREHLKPLELTPLLAHDLRPQTLVVQDKRELPVRELVPASSFRHLLLDCPELVHRRLRKPDLQPVIFKRLRFRHHSSTRSQMIPMKTEAL